IPPPRTWAQLVGPPALMETAEVPSRETPAAIALADLRSFASASPQHATAPVSRRAHAWSPPAAIWTTLPCRPTTATGRLLDFLVLSPSWPSSLSPQHLTAPALVRAHAW